MMKPLIFLIFLLSSMSFDSVVLSKRVSPSPKFKRFFEILGYRNDQQQFQSYQQQQQIPQFGPLTPCAIALTTTPAPIPLLVGPLCRVVTGSGPPPPQPPPQPQPQQSQYPPPSYKPAGPASSGPGSIFVGLGPFQRPPVAVPLTTDRPGPVAASLTSLQGPIPMSMSMPLPSPSPQLQNHRLPVATGNQPIESKQPPSPTSVRPERIPGTEPLPLAAAQMPGILKNVQGATQKDIEVIEPFVPPGFVHIHNNVGQELGTEEEKKCPLFPTQDMPLCSTMDTLEKLQLRKIHGYILKAGLEQLFQVTSNWTFFAPADPAFATLPEWFLTSLESDVKLLRALILNHFIKVDAPLVTLGNDFLILNARPGGNRIRTNVYFPDLPYRTYTLDGSKVILGDLRTQTGRLNIVNQVIVPHPRRNAASYLQDISEFSDFLSVVESADMLQILEKSDPITLFIPSNEAFRTFDLKILEGNVTALKNFVQYHIVQGTFYSNGLLDGQHLTTLFDKEVKLSVTSDGFTKTLNGVNNVNCVLKADIPLSNGVAHVVNKVMSTVPEFYFYEHMIEFPNLNFGTLKRRQLFVSDNHI